VRRSIVILPIFVNNITNNSLIHLQKKRSDQTVHFRKKFRLGLFVFSQSDDVAVDRLSMSITYVKKCFSLLAT